MRIVTFALGSFMLGAVFMLAVGNHTSTFLHPVFAQTPAEALRNPYVPVITPPGRLSKNNLNSGVIDLDGTASIGDQYVHPTFRYGGGAYVLSNAVIAPPVKVELIGAAANTAAFLNMLGMLGCPAKTPQAPAINPNAPTLQTASLTTPLKGDFKSLYPQK